jgi:hypothetical protein
MLAGLAAVAAVVVALSAQRSSSGPSTAASPPPAIARPSVEPAPSVIEPKSSTASSKPTEASTKAPKPTPPQEAKRIVSSAEIADLDLIERLLRAEFRGSPVEIRRDAPVELQVTIPWGSIFSDADGNNFTNKIRDDLAKIARIVDPVSSAGIVVDLYCFSARKSASCDPDLYRVAAIDRMLCDYMECGRLGGSASSVAYVEDRRLLLRIVPWPHGICRGC